MYNCLVASFLNTRYSVYCTYNNSYVCYHRVIHVSKNFREGEEKVWACTLNNYHNMYTRATIFTPKELRIIVEIILVYIIMQWCVIIVFLF